MAAALGRWAMSNPASRIPRPASLLVAACLLAIACRDDPKPASILLFSGSGTSPGDVAAVESVLHDAHLGYTTASSVQLGAMAAPQLQAYRLLIVPEETSSRSETA